MKEFYTNIRQYGNNLLYRGYDASGNALLKKIPYAPTIYAQCPETEKDKECYDGTPLKAMSFDSINSAKDHLKDFSNVQNVKHYGNSLFSCAYIAETFAGELEFDVKAINKCFFDIEVNSANGFPDPFIAKEEVTSIAYKDAKKNIMYVWSCEKWGKFDSENLKHISKDELTFEIVSYAYENEKKMLLSFVNFIQLNPPDILSGWYSRHFDIPYLVNRLQNLFGPSVMKKLSPWKIVNTRTNRVKQFGTLKTVTTYDIVGVSELDYRDLYMKYTYSKEPSYSLDYITKKHLKVGKMEYEGTLTDLLQNDYQTYCEYNIIDTHRIHQLDTKLQFLDLIIDVTYSGKVPEYTDSLGTVKYWEILIYQHLHDKGIIPEIKEYENGDEYFKFEGGYVKEPLTGQHRWVVSFDLASLYPNIIRQVNIGPETKITRLDIDHMDFVNELLKTSDILKQYGDVSIAGNGALYRKDFQSFLSELMEKFFNKRKVFKKKMFETEHLLLKTDSNSEDYRTMKTLHGVYKIKQLSTKILINAAYGALGNKYFQYFDIDNASAVTLTGQTFIKTSVNKINEYMTKVTKKDKDFVIAVDTDSLYIDFSDIVDTLMKGETDPQIITEKLDIICKKKFEPMFADIFKNMFTYMNHKDLTMAMEREIIADKAVWTGKKRYAMNVYDKEGVRYQEPEMKIMGLEVVKSSTPLVVRDRLEESLSIILRKDENTLHNFVRDFKKEFFMMSPEQIAFPRGTNEIAKWVDGVTGQYNSGIPIHVRAALVYNKLLTEKNLTDKYDLIRAGDSILFLYLKMPNILKENVFAFLGEYPKETNIARFIDYELQFEKTFLDPLKAITDEIGWKCEKENDLKGIFF